VPTQSNHPWPAKSNQIKHKKQPPGKRYRSGRRPPSADGMEKNNCAGFNCCSGYSEFCRILLLFMFLMFLLTNKALPVMIKMKLSFCFSCVRRKKRVLILGGR
jgi:hypothetical protein